MSTKPRGMKVSTWRFAERLCKENRARMAQENQTKPTVAIANTPACAQAGAAPVQ